MALRLGNIGKIGSKLGLTDDKGYGVAVFIALIIVSSVVGYYVFFMPAAQGYSTIYVLDSQKMAVDYPEVLVANQNSTFNVWINVENHMASPQNYQVLIKITNDPLSFPVDIQASKVYEISNLADSQSWEEMASLTLNEVGSYSVVFELWQYKGDALEFTYNYNVLNVQVIS